MTHPNLFTVYPDATGGSVNRPASRQRARDEADDGTLTARQTAILNLLHEAGHHGMTWRDIGFRLGLHHGQVSGALSNLHACGQVTMLRATHNRCHPYVHGDYRHAWGIDERWDTPTRTRAGERRTAHEQLRHVCQQAVVNGWTDADHDAIVTALAALE